MGEIHAQLIDRNVSNTRAVLHDDAASTARGEILINGRSPGKRRCADVSTPRPCSSRHRYPKLKELRESRQNDYIRADFDLDFSKPTPLQIASFLYSLLDFLVSCSCLSTPSLVPLVPSAQCPFWPLHRAYPCYGDCLLHLFGNSQAAPIRRELETCPRRAKRGRGESLHLPPTLSCSSLSNIPSELTVENKFRFVSMYRAILRPPQTLFRGHYHDARDTHR
jgi:hypothetical protein